uniref:Uncharacterized protein n=1 Tax=Sphaerodactylus townsendi TaxID=933632 RepID=A0ACB8EGR6_9SAUR
MMDESHGPGPDAAMVSLQMVKIHFGAGKEAETVRDLVLPVQLGTLGNKSSPTILVGCDEFNHSMSLQELKNLLLNPLHSQVAAENLQEAELHYAELQNFLDSSRGQCDGGTCPAPAAAQTSDYATVAELKGSNGEAYVSQEENEDSGLDDGQKENELLEEQE